MIVLSSIFLISSQVVYHEQTLTQFKIDKVW